MKRVVSLVLTVLLMLSLCSCGKEDVTLSGATKPLEILLNEEDVLHLEIPVELSLIKRDNVHYWEYSSGIGIYRMTSTNTSAKYDEESGLYLSNSSVIRNFEDCCVVINCTGDVRDYFIKALSVATVSQKDAKPYIELALKQLPSYTVMEDMELQNDIYMPPNCEDVLYDIYTSKLYTNGTDWLQSIIVDEKLEDLRPRLLTLATLNSGTDRVSAWYESDEIFYCYTDSCIVGAKKLAFNSWYVYQGSPTMNDYILTGINKVHGQTTVGTK